MLITDSQENHIWYWTLEQFDMLNQFSLTIQQQKNYRYNIQKASWYMYN